MGKAWESTNLFLGTFWTGWRRWLAWFLCLGSIISLGVVRSTSDADFTFASLAIVPVLIISWIGGMRSGLLVAFLAAATWIVGDTVASERQFSANWVPWANAATRLMTYGLVAILAALVRLQLDREHANATRDALTGLQNRRAFLSAGAAEVERSKRYGHPMAVIFLDLDDFKQLNDSKGHDVGDAALRSTAKALLSTLRNSDMVARLGGDEFSVLLPEIDYDAVVEAGRKIFSAVNATLKDYPPVTASLGVAWFGTTDHLFPAMLKEADALMYEVKESGKHDMRTRRFSELNTSPNNASSGPA